MKTLTRNIIIVFITIIGNISIAQIKKIDSLISVSNKYGNDTNKVKTFLNENDIPFDSINENPPFFKSTSRKIYSNILLDDRAGLFSAYWQLKNVIHNIKHGVL